MRPKNYQELENDIALALLEARSIAKPNLRQIAIKYGVPYSRFRRRYHGGDSKSSRPRTNLQLKPHEEQLLIGFIKHMDDLCIGTPVATVQAAATHIRNLRDETPPPLGPRWAINWIKYAKQELGIFKVRQKTLDKERKEAHDPQVIDKWYNQLQTATTEYNIYPENTWNFDETCFRLGIGGDSWVVTYMPGKVQSLASSDSRETATVVESISAIGQVIEPMVILEGKHLLRKWFEDANHVASFTDKTLVAVNETGYMNDLLAVEFMKHFERLTRPKKPHQYRLLLFDGYESHCTYEFIEYAWRHKIVPFKMPPHTSHLLQPCDLGPFQPYKHHHRKAVNTDVRAGSEGFNKIDFIFAFNDIRAKTFTRRTIKHGWSQAGIYPFNPQPVVDRLKAEAPPREQEVPAKQAIIQYDWYDDQVRDSPLTPRTIRKTVFDHIMAGSDSVLTPRAQRRTHLFMAASMHVSKKAALLEWQNHTMATAAKNKAARQSSSRRSYGKTAIIYAEGARRITRQEEVDEAIKLQKQLDAVLAKEERQYAVKMKKICVQVKKQLKDIFMPRREKRHLMQKKTYNPFIQGELTQLFNQPSIRQAIIDKARRLAIKAQESAATRWATKQRELDQLRLDDWLQASGLVDEPVVKTP